MSEMSKKARAALREKAKRLSTEKDMKVDSSNWTPAEPLEAQAKTGMRPVSRRNFKKGGKVTGDPSVKHAGRKARKAGGRLVANDKTEAKDIAIAKMNRNQKEANQSREGIKHIGGLKRGGRAACNVGGAPTGVLKKAIGSMMTGGMKKGGNVKRKGHSNGERVDEIGDLIRTLPDTGNTPEANSAVMPQRAPAPKVEEVSPADAARMRAIMNRSTRDSMQAERDEAARKLFQLRGFKKGGKTKARKAGGQVMHYGPSEENEGENLPKDLSGQKKLENAAATRSKPTRGKAQNYANGGAPDSRMAIVKPRMFDFGAGTSGSPYKKGGAAKHPDEAMDKALIKKMVKPEARKGKNEGGAADKKPPKIEFDPADPTARLKSVDYGGKLPPGKPLVSPRASGGKAKHPDEKMDKALIKKMVKPSARKGKADGGMSALGGLLPALAGEGDKAGLKGLLGLAGGMKSGGKATKKRPGKFYGGAMGGNAPQMVPPAPQQGMMPPAAMPGMDAGMQPPAPMPMPAGNPSGYARGGKTKGKGKTNINIVIAAGQKPEQPGMMPPPGGPGGPGGPPAGGGVPVPMSAGPGGPPAPMPMPMPMPMPAGAPPMARKAGGRISKVASSYKDMTAGSGSGEGRLQKTDIAKRTNHKAGGKIYRSYKDMDAGAGSGFGRLEKTEIQKRK
jgi:hypothetical protein